MDSPGHKQRAEANKQRIDAKKRRRVMMARRELGNIENLLKQVDSKIEILKAHLQEEE